MQSIRAYLKASYEEFVLRTTWPSWTSLQKSTVVVIAGSLLIALMVFAMDNAISAVLDFINSIFS